MRKAGSKGARLSPFRASSKARIIPAWRTSATCGKAAMPSASAAIRVAVPRLRASTASDSKIESEASPAAQASGLPV